MITYRIEFEYFQDMEKTTSDGYSGGPYGWQKKFTSFNAQNHIKARSKARKIIREHRKYYKTRNILLLKRVYY